MRDRTTRPVDSDPRSSDPRAEASDIDVLAIAWSAEEPWRVGEVVVPPPLHSGVLGRGEGEGSEARVRIVRQRPGAVEPAPALAGAGLSRRQLLVRVAHGEAIIERIGRCELRVNGKPCERASLRLGDVVHLHRQVVLVYLRRPAFMPSCRFFPRASWGAFGEPDAYGMLGESPAMWLLRDQLAFVARSSAHALLVGASGTGKELAARAIHAMSDRASKPLVARNAATLPSSLIDAELFGSAKNYPNAGMPERPGLIGHAHGGTLFLDEIGELPLEQQSHLLRVLDSGGEYQRLGEAVTRRSDFRLIAATNRDPSVIKHDLRARLISTVELSPLASRREDIPLLARHLVLGTAKRSPEIAGGFVGQDANGRPAPRFAPSFVEHVLGQNFETNTRQLEAIVWKAMSDASGDEIRAPHERGREASPAPVAPRAVEPSAQDVRLALAEAGGRPGKAASILGLSSRFTMYRLMKKFGIDTKSSE